MCPACMATAAMIAAGAASSGGVAAFAVKAVTKRLRPKSAPRPLLPVAPGGTAR